MSIENWQLEIGYWKFKQGGIFAFFAFFLTRHSSKSDGWFAANKGIEVEEYGEY